MKKTMEIYDKVKLFIQKCAQRLISQEEVKSFTRSIDVE